MIKKIVLSMLGLLVALVALVFVIGYAVDTDTAAMEAKYGRTPLLRTQASGLRYRDDGNPNGPVLLLLHGANSSLQTWEPMVEALAGQFRLVSFDQHGHGLTGPHAQHDYSAETRVQAGLEVLDELKLDCEGSELSILRVFKSQNALGRIGVIVGEYHGGDSGANALRTILKDTHWFTYHKARRTDVLGAFKGFPYDISNTR